MIAVIRFFCQANPTFATSVVNGLLASATVLGGFIALLSGLPAALALFVPVKPEARADAINKGAGCGFLVGMVFALLTLFVFSARLVS